MTADARFELRLPADLKALAQAHAAKTGETVSELVLRALDRQMSADRIAWRAQEVRRAFRDQVWLKGSLEA